MRRRRAASREPGNRPAGDARQEPKIEAALQVLLQRLTRLRGAVDAIPVPTRRERRLSYADAIGWFIANRPEEDAVTQGAILRAPLPGDRIGVTLAFLDGAGELVCDAEGKPYASRIAVDELDDELTDAFGDAPLLIVK